MKDRGPKKARPKRARRPSRAEPRSRPTRGEGGDVAEAVDQVSLHPETSPRLTGGDVDADWVGAYATGEEAVGGSVSTPDQDVVDELGRALGVEQADEEEVRTAEEILHARDRRRWSLEWEAEHGKPPGAKRKAE